jgi:hypothetical protein
MEHKEGGSACDPFPSRGVKKVPPPKERRVSGVLRSFVKEKNFAQDW